MSTKNNRFINYAKKPVYSKDYSAPSDLYNSKGNLGIVLQGPLRLDNNFTLETIKIYLKTFPGAKIVLSTWEGEDEETLSKIRDLGIFIVQSRIPEYKGFANTNYQIVSSIEGLKKLKELNVEYAIKTRTDQRIYETNVFEYFMGILKTFPLEEDVKKLGQKERLIGISLDTFKYRLYGVSDMFLFGHIDDVHKYWSCKLDDRVFDVKETTLKSLYINKIAEVYFCTEYLKKLGYEIKDTLEDSWNVYRKFFCIVDEVSLGFYWPKYTNDIQRWRNYENINPPLEEFNFKEWLCLYSGQEKFIPEHYVQPDKPVEEELIITRTACLGNFSLDKLSTYGYTINNHQKNRVDYALKIHEDNSCKIDYDYVKDFIREKKIGLEEIWQMEQEDIFGQKNPKMLIMDSFAELTDKLFVSKNSNSSFCSHYADIDHKGEFDSLYNCLDLLPKEKLEGCYDEFFRKINETYGEIPIVFIHFPAKFDTRERYNEQAQAILNAINNLKEKYKNLISIELDYIEKNPNDDFVYHFSDKTIECLAYKIACTKLLDLKSNKESGSKNKVQVLLRNIFSVRNEYRSSVKRKIITILGIKLRIKVKKSA